MIRHVDWSRHPHVRTGDDLTFGERAADKAVRFMGSWAFLTGQTVMIVGWIILNVIGIVAHWDEYPFILLNLAFSTQAAYAAPLILLAARRQNQRADEMARSDLDANLEALQILRELRDRNGVLTSWSIPPP